MSTEETTFIIYGMPGSQYTAKVLCALDSKKIPHSVVFVDLDPSKRQLPSGGTMVPELQVLHNNKTSIAIVPDSESILHWFQDNLSNINFFPTPQTSDVSLRAGNGVLAGAVLYYNWVHPEGYQQSMHVSLGKALPSFVFVFRSYIIDYFARDARRSFRIKSAELLGFDLNDTKQREQFENESVVHTMLVKELEYFQSLLSSNESSYMLSQKEPTAADFSIYAQVERLVGTMGDVHVPCSLPSLKIEPSLKQFWKWLEVMQQEHPIRFKGKRAKKM